MKKSMEKTFEEINKKRKLPKDVMENIIKEIYVNFIISIGIMIYFIFLIMGSANSNKGIRIIDFKIFSMLLLAIAIILFEYSYKKDNGKIAIHGIESLFVAIVTLFLPYIIFELNSMQRQYYFMIGTYISVYYIIKAIFICINENKKYKKSNSVSDIKEIIKKEKIISQRKKDKEDKIGKEDEAENTKEVVNTTKIKKDKIRTQVKVETKKKQQKKIVEEQKPKSKRGRPKKNINEKSIPVIDESKTIVTTKAEVKKGRGRPRKVVS